jgi:amicoumacin kinase
MCRLEGCHATDFAWFRPIKSAMAELVDTSKLAIKAIELWNGDAKSCREIADSANRVYSFLESGQTRYLRLISTSSRTKPQVEAELDFIFHLRRGGISAMPPVPSAAGRLIEELGSEENAHLASVFEEAQGEQVAFGSASFNKEYLRLRGRTLGKIHALSKTFVPSGNRRRPTWDEDPLLLTIDGFLPTSETLVRKKYQALGNRLQYYPKSHDTYGLIHGDFGETNLRSANGQLNVFDFDDCCYCWFACDLAIAIYPHGWRKEGLQFLNWMIEGYSEIMPWHAPLADITMFCQWRLVYMFLVYARKWGLQNLSPRQAEWFTQKRENIARGYQWYS